jgi:thioredoxin 1
MWLIVHSIWNKKGASIMGKVGKVAIVVVLAAVVGVVVMKRGGSSAPSSQPATQAADGLPRLVDLGSTNCIPCRMMAPILEELKKEFTGRMHVEFIDVNINPDQARAYGIRVIPTQVFLDATGKELWRHEGFFSKEDILAKWKELGVSLASPAGGAATTGPAAVPAVKKGST